VFAQAQSQKDVKGCSDAIVKLVGEHFHLDNFVLGKSDNDGLIVSGRCKLWSKNKSRVIAAFAYDAGVEGEKLLVVSVIDTRANKIVSAYENTIQEGAGRAIGEDSLRIDIARYDMAPEVRAFGIEIYNSKYSPYNPNCADGGADGETTLYISDGMVLRPILYLFPLSSWSFVQGGNMRCGARADLATIIENVSLSLEMGKTETNGYRDIVIRAKSSRDDSKPARRGIFAYSLRYNGSKYPTDKMQEALWKWESRKP
jgi:hypothetical protein